jgi:hypothetical protein
VTDYYWATALPGELADALGALTGSLAPLAINVADSGLSAGEFTTRLDRIVERKRAGRTVRLPDGTTGYYTPHLRQDACWQYAVATCLQVEPDEVVDWRLDERVAAGEAPEDVNAAALEEFAAWLCSRGLQVTYHESPPLELERWIGVVPVAGWFESHTLVMCRGDVLFDPSDPTLHSRPLRKWKPSHCAIGFSFGQ